MLPNFAMLYLLSQYQTNRIIRAIEEQNQPYYLPPPSSSSSPPTIEHEPPPSPPPSPSGLRAAIGPIIFTLALPALLWSCVLLTNLTHH